MRSAGSMKLGCALPSGSCFGGAGALPVFSSSSFFRRFLLFPASYPFCGGGFGPPPTLFGGADFASHYCLSAI